MHRMYYLAAILLLFITLNGCSDNNGTGPEQPKYGSIAISSEPTGAAIWLDGRDTKLVTPNTLKRVDIGTRVIKLTLENHADWFDSVLVETDEVAIIHAKLISTIGSIAINSQPSGASIYLDGFNTSKKTPDILTNVSVGDHAIQLKLTNYVEWLDTVRVGSDSLTVVEATLVYKTGAIAVNSVPAGASIWLDSVQTGLITPDTLTEVPIGSHVVQLTLEGYDDYEKSIYLSYQEIRTINATLIVQCPGDIIGDLGLPPEIQFIDLQPGDRTIYGSANNVDASIIRVVLWAKTDIWYVQPYVAWPYTDICGDGSWKNGTHSWIRMLALLVDSTYNPGATRRYHPATDSGVIAWVEYPSSSADRYIDFSAYRWLVKTGDLPLGPGPNYFSDNIDNVWLDLDNRLHLKFDFRDGKWYCAEVVLDHSLGYGVYTFQLDSRVDSLNYNAVFAGFVYESGTREIDVEFSQLLSNPHNAQYVIQPWNNPGNIEYYDMPTAIQSTHQFEWRADKIVFTSWSGHSINPQPGDTIYTWTYTGSDIPPPGGERMRFNLWLFGGNPPTSGQADEVIINSFSYQP